MFLLARINNNGGFNNDDDNAAAIMTAVIIGACICVAIGLGIQIFFLLTMQKALNRCSRRNRTMEPGMVWLNIIPCFQWVWMFITVNRIAESLDNEFYQRRLKGGGDFGKGVGTAYCVLVLTSMIPYLGSLLAIGALVCWIIYWVKIAGFSKRLADDSSRHYDDDDYNFTDDSDNPLPRRDRDDYDDERGERPRRSSRDRDNDYEDDRHER